MADRLEQVVEVYVQALRDGLLHAGLAESCVFVSPFSRWEGSKPVGRAFAARSIAFTGLQILHWTDGTPALVRWDATVGDDQVEGCELLTIVGGRIERVDVFLRPAVVLPAVFDAMSAAWPR